MIKGYDFGHIDSRLLMRDCVIAGGSLTPRCSRHTYRLMTGALNF